MTDHVECNKEINQLRMVAMAAQSWQSSRRVRLGWSPWFRLRYCRRIAAMARNDDRDLADAIERLSPGLIWWSS